MRSLHDRKPVILDSASDGVWLDPRSSADVLRSLFIPFASERMEAIPVSPWVSDPKREGARCLESMIAQLRGRYHEKGIGLRLNFLEGDLLIWKMFPVSVSRVGRLSVRSQQMLLFAFAVARG
jgi:hypothetical protein